MIQVGTNDNMVVAICKIVLLDVQIIILKYLQEGEKKANKKNIERR